MSVREAARAAATGRTDGAPERARPRRFRPDIQALRAVAVTAVVLNHLWPLRVSGGYVGVDVFFVISGFLITSHLVREITATGGLSLGQFYARRVRRLLPAAFLVLAVAGVGVALFLPYPQWERNGAEILASAFYAENWLLAAFSVDYSALNESATVAQHYWSLSVEEQFYLIWPLLLLVAAWWARRRGARPNRVMIAVLVALFTLSLAASLFFTVATPAQAYFVTQVRVWEFAAGALVAFTAHRLRMGAALRNALSLAGFAAIFFGIFLLRPSSPFPGYLALVPVMGTAAVIIAGTGAERQWHTAVTSWRPVQWLGDISYSLYLWHWPLIVLAPFVLVSELTTFTKVAIVALSLALAWLTRRWVEEPGQSWRYLKMSSRRTFVAMICGMGVIGSLGGGLLAGYHLQSAADRPPIAIETDQCAGPGALIHPETCADPFRPAASTVMGARNEYFWMPPECGDFEERLAYGDKRTTRVCDFSDGDGDGVTQNVWLVGDSHAQQWQNAIFDLGRKNGWRVTISYFGGCPVADVDFLGFRAAWGAADADLCRRWSSEVTAEIAQEAPQLVFTSMAARQQLVDDGSGAASEQQWTDGLHRTWQRWSAQESRVVVLGDVPLNGQVRSPDCVSLNPDDPAVCAVERAVAQPFDPLVTAAQADPEVTLVDVSPLFCDQTSCYAVVGGTAVYYDADHLNLEYVRSAVPWIESTLLADGLR